MEVYAAMVDDVDQNVGRLVQGLADLGELDNTIIVFTSDNGASREGEESGTSGYYVHLLGKPEVEADLPRIDLLGGPQTMPHYPRGWAMAGNTPFRLYKINTHAGGHSVPFVFSWPDGLAARGRAPPSVRPRHRPPADPARADRGGRPHGAEREAADPHGRALASPTPWPTPTDRRCGPSRSTRSRAIGASTATAGRW